MCGAVIVMTPFESAVRGSLEGSRGGRTHVHYRNDLGDRATPLSGTQLIVVQHLTVARVAEGLGVAWDTANDAVLAEGKRVLIDDEHRFDGVTAIGVDEGA